MHYVTHICQYGGIYDLFITQLLGHVTSTLILAMQKFNNIRPQRIKIFRSLSIIVFKVTHLHILKNLISNHWIDTKFLIFKELIIFSKIDNYLILVDNYL